MKSIKKQLGNLETDVIIKLYWSNTITAVLLKRKETFLWSVLDYLRDKIRLLLVNETSTALSK